MPAFENITDKIVLLLSKTKDALLQDLEKEFSSVREALEKAAKDANSSNPSGFKDALVSIDKVGTDYKKVVDAVFARVGLDLSQCDNLDKLQTLIGRPLTLLEDLAANLDDVKKSDGSIDYMALFQALLDTGKDVIQLVKDFQNVEMSKIEDELRKTFGNFYDEFSLKDFALSVLEHILITILKSGRDVFSEEIKYTQLQANKLYDSVTATVGEVQDGINAIRKQIESSITTQVKALGETADDVDKMVRALFKETVRDMEDVYDTVSEEVKKAVNDVANSQTVKELAEAYQKVSAVLAKVYAVLDFLGIVGKKRMELRVPETVINKLKAAGTALGGALQGASGAVQGFVANATGVLNGAIEGATGLVQGAANEAIGNVNSVTGTVTEGVYTALDTVTEAFHEENVEKIDLSLDLLNIPKVSIPDYSAQIASVSGAMQNALSSYVGDAVNMVSGFSYHFTIATFKWGRVEKMFSDPMSYFKEIYPVNSIEDAEELATKLIDIIRIFNPDIPDFKSLRGMLESLLRELGEMALSCVEEYKKELWAQVKPLMTMIRKVLDMLQEMYETLKRESIEILDGIKKEVIDKIVDPLHKDVEQAGKEAQAAVKTLKELLAKIDAPEFLDDIYTEIIAPAVLEAVEKSSATDPKQTVDGIATDAKKVFEAWGTGVSTHLGNFFSEDAWKERLDKTIDSLGATFAADVDAVKGFLKPSLLNDFSAIGDKASALKDELDISQYISIISSAFDDVSVPNPELYYEGFKQAVGAIIKKTGAFTDGYDIKQVETFISDAAAGIWERVRNKVLKPLVREIKRLLLRIIRQAITEVLNAILDKLPSYKDFVSQETENALRLYYSEAKARVQDVRQTVGAVADAASGGAVPAAQAALEAIGQHIDIPIDQEWKDAAKAVAKAAVDFCSTDKGYGDILKLIIAIYKAIPKSAIRYVSDLLPSLPQNETVDSFVDFVKGMDYKADLDESFAIVTVLDVKSDDEKEKEKAKDGSTIEFKASALLQLVIFAAEVPSDDDASVDDQSPEKNGTAGKTKGKTAQEGTASGGKEKGEEENEEEEKKEAALYCMVIVNGKVGLSFNIGSNHTMSLEVSGSAGGKAVETVDDDNRLKLREGVGFYITKDWKSHGIFDTKALQAMFVMTFDRKNDSDALKVFDTKYLSLTIDNYPQAFYLGFGTAYPELLSTEKYGAPKPEAGDQGLQVGYFGAIKGAKFALHLSDVAFVKEVIKDDVELELDTYLWYDFVKGFDFGGDVSLHLDFDMNHKKLGPLVIDSFSVDAGTPEGEKGKLQLAVASTFQVDFGGALVVAVENLGIGFLINYKDKDGNYGDFDLDASLQYPSGFGLSVDASAVKGAGIIQIDQKTGEFFGALELVIIKKIGVGAFVLCDPGTAKGHDFSMVVLLSARFSPGIPLGMGFSLTGIGGTLGLNRQISRDAIQNGVRTGTLDQVFFVENIKEHLAEMKTNVITYFPEKKGQFFFGILGQISYEPVVKCDFGLLLQLPKPTEIIIVGALRVNAAEGIVKINVYFAGGINFEEGMWFDASIVDSQIVGISISGDMAFRLNWGGTKGFLLSIGGFHPAYKPEEGLHVGKMNRLAMKLDYSILKLSFETYMAITSNSFQIGARFDLKVGWDDFGITGYAGFDALFQFDPFLFMFSVCAGVAVKCGDWNLLSIDLSMDVQGPAPWKISGKAKFWFVFVPIKVDFSKTWGKDTPELPSKLVEVIPLLQKEWENENNWTIDNSNAAGQTLVSLFDAPEGVMIAQPDGSVSFNQSAVPMRTEETKDRPYSLEKMDICNDAVPQDYNSIYIEKVNDQEVGDGNLVMEQNDFAPSLYKLMGVKEKLSSESYLKYDSGFTMNMCDSFKESGVDDPLTRSVSYFWQPLDRKEVSGSNVGSKVQAFSAGEEKLTASVKQVKNMQSKTVEVTPPVTSNSKVVRPSTPQKVVRPANAKAVRPSGTTVNRQEYGNVNVPSGSLDLSDLVAGRVSRTIQAVSNNRRDRAAFDRYLAVLQKKAEKTNK